MFDYTQKNALLFSQGDFGLIKRDLLYAGVDDASIQALENGPCAELLRAYRVRRELIHYKKVCLHLFEEARKIERELKQATSFFFWDDDDNKEEGARAHLEAIVSLAPSDMNDEVSPLDLDAVKTAMERHERGDSCELLDRKVLYVLASGAWMYHRGVSKAIHDARDVAKAICMSPRHPDGEVNGERPFKLRTLPTSMQVHAAVSKAEREDPFDSSRAQKKERVKDSKDECESDCNAEKDGGDGDDNDNSLENAKGSTAMQRILCRVRSELQWPDEAVEFLSLSIAARGGFKALAIVEELSLYNMHLSKIPDRLEKTLNLYKDAQSGMIDHFADCGLDSNEDVLSAAVSRHREIHHLRGTLKACRENAKWVEILESLAYNTSEDGGSSTSRLFVAGDNAASNNTCAFVPKGFELGSFVASSRELLDRILMPTMQNVLAFESWPPTTGSRRNRVLAFDEFTIQNAQIGKKKLQQCLVCCGFFDSRWIRHQLCSICEVIKREQSDNTKCFFVGCKAGAEAYCPHFRRCFVCDAPHSCDELCRLSRGNGEVATALVETIRPKLLLVDFDRTLASTKSGASPLPKRTSVRHAKEGYSHSIDSELRAAVIAQQAYGESHVVTRNSHKPEIEEFLRMHGLQELAKNIHVVPKKVSKGTYIRETFSNSENDPASIIFVDDDIRELSIDTWLRTSPHVHRILFVRAFLQ